MHANAGTWDAQMVLERGVVAPRVCVWRRSGCLHIVCAGYIIPSRLCVARVEGDAWICAVEFDGYVQLIAMLAG